MSKLTTIFWLFLILISIFVLNMIFGNPLLETFSNYLLSSENQFGSKLDYNIKINKDTKNSNLKYPGLKYLGIDTTGYEKEKEDDQPLFFGFRI